MAWERVKSTQSGSRHLRRPLASSGDVDEATPSLRNSFRSWADGHFELIPVLPGMASQIKRSTLDVTPVTADFIDR
jgi:hypothetical protein